MLCSRRNSVFDEEPAQPDLDADGESDGCDFDDGAVNGLRFDEAGLAWFAEEGAESYSVYRGELGHPALWDQAICLAGEVALLTFADFDLPAPGEGFFYLVARQAAGAQGPLGVSTGGVPRSVATWCPDAP